MNNKVFVVGAAVIAIGVFAVVSFQNRSENKTATPSPVKSNEVSPTVEKKSEFERFVRPHSPRFGNSMARVTVVEWLDPECEACRALFPVVKKLISTYENKVLFVIRYMPYHQGSMFAATALEEARELGKFEEALSILFEKQPEWGDHRQPRPDLIPSYLLKLGIPKENLDQEKLSAKHGEKIRQDKEDGEAIGVKGTPSFFINEAPLRQLGEEPLRAAIEAALSTSN